MTRFCLVFLLLLASTTTLNAQLTADQRIADFLQLGSRYNKNYGPYEWKRTVFGFDLLNMAPWFARAADVTDLEFHDLLIEYVASLNDAHDLIAFPTNYFAQLGFSVDIYDNTVLIDSINRSRLPATDYPFAIGDELVSVDGRTVQQLMRSFRKYAISANERSTSRTAASRITARSQQIMPFAFDVPATATVVIRLASTGVETTFTMPWLQTGIAIGKDGPVPSPRLGPRRMSVEAEKDTVELASPKLPSQWMKAEAGDNTLPPYMEPARSFLNLSVPAEYYMVLNLGGRFPIYNAPPGFVLRLGGSANDFFLSGTYVSNGVRIGLLRIPSFGPASAAQALQALDQEIAFFNANTDGLIVDVMRNPGGSGTFTEAVLQRMMTAPFRTMTFQFRAAGEILFSFALMLSAAEQANAPTPVIENLRRAFETVQRAYFERRGLTDPVPINALGSEILQPAAVSYSKPIMVLVDEFSASAGDMFPAVMQDNRRGTIFGMRTMGAGGSVAPFDGTTFTEGIARVTLSLMHRSTVVRTNEFPPTPYVENVGVRPDIVVDYMTRRNLLTGGQPFVQAFTEAMVNLVRSTTAQ
jgi:hypothetical protein